MPVVANQARAARSACAIAVAFVVLAIAGCSSDGARATGTLQAPDSTQTTVNQATSQADNVVSGAASSRPSAADDAGDVPGLTGLCQGGSDLACDILFHYTDHDSDAEAIALDCGGRGSASNSFCTAGIVDDPPNVWFATDSVALGEIVGACQDGDMTACDFLFVRSPVGSRFERIGLTCGDRTPVASPDCRRGLG